MTIKIALAAAILLVQEPKDLFLLQGVDKSNVREAKLRDEDIAGLSIRVSWASIEPGGRADYQWLDSQVARCRAIGKPYMLRLMAGTNSPRWIKGAWHQDAPVPWNQDAQAALSQTIRRLGERYSDDALLVCVHMSSTANYKSAEMHLAPGLRSLPDYSDDKIIAAWKAAIDSYSDAFPNCALALNATLEPDRRGAITFPVIEHCQSRLGDRATFQHNSLKAATSPRARHHRLILDLRRNTRVGFQMACPTSNTRRFGGTLQQALRLAPGASFFEIYQGDTP